MYIFLVSVDKEKPTRVQEKRGDKYSIHSSLNQIICPSKFYVPSMSKHSEHKAYDIYIYIYICMYVRIVNRW